MQRIVKMNKTEDEEITDDQLSDEEITNLSDGTAWLLTKRIPTFL